MCIRDRHKAIAVIIRLHFYRAMHYVHSAELRSHVVCPSVRLFVCPSVTFRYGDHIGWNSSKIISRPNSIRPWLWGTQYGPSGATGTPPKLWPNRVGVTLQDRKPAISPKRCEIRPRLLLRTNRNSYTRFRLVPKSGVPKE